jgi:hypothetical protein
MPLRVAWFDTDSTTDFVYFICDVRCQAEMEKDRPWGSYWQKVIPASPSRTERCFVCKQIIPGKPAAAVQPVKQSTSNQSIVDRIRGWFT